MKPLPTLLAVRAIGAEFASRLWKNILIWVVIASVILIGLLTWLVTLSNWWWLVALPITVALSVAATVLVIFFLLIRYVRPEQNKTQRKQVKKFADKLQFVTEITSTPKVIILFRTVRSIAAPKSDRYLQEIFEAKDLKKDFGAIVGEFEG